MIDMPVKKITANEAVGMGLIEAIKSGDAVVTGVYSVGKDLKVDFSQRNFFFTTNDGEVVLAKFADNIEIIKFWEILGDESAE